MMRENPGRPPKKWMRDCERGAAGSARDPGAACGALWYHKMSPAAKRAALARERRLEENPNTGLWVLGAAVVAGGAIYFLTREKTASAAPGAAAPTTPPPALPPAVSCSVDQARLTQWGATAGVVPFYVPFPGGPPPSAGELKAMLPLDMQAQLSALPSSQAVVFVLSDNSFWYYANDASAPVQRTDLYADYCQKYGTLAGNFALGGHPADFFTVW